ncbi:hypothetical protein F0562_011180 [Nyssa sinensis]|uniref:Uncharacterized protein n=1 Tax=Nyssa sinensis TaxID=561372 RepID=A0A5J5A5Y8_9ASTE|nr:hypothetical protein F0562_011180 [Nyssa sinensis]
MYISRHILFDEMQTHPSVRTEQPKPYESPFPFPHTIPSSPSPQIGTHAPVPRSPISLSSQLSPPLASSGTAVAAAAAPPVVMPHLGRMLIMDEGSPCFVPFSKAKKGRVSKMSTIQVLEDSEGFDGRKKRYLDALVGNSAAVPKTAGNMSGGMQAGALNSEA